MMKVRVTHVGSKHRRFGPGRAVAQGDRVYVEHGEWF